MASPLSKTKKAIVGVILGVLLSAMVCVTLQFKLVDNQTSAKLNSSLARKKMRYTGNTGDGPNTTTIKISGNDASLHDGGSSPTTKQEVQHPSVLLFITTIFSQQHQDYFRCCWPQLIRESRLLNRTHVMIFSNSNTTGANSSAVNSARNVFAQNPSLQFKLASQDEINEVEKYPGEMRKQVGANLGVKLGFSEKWFEPYDWVIRINPDVLIRNSTWLWETMKNPSVDAILVPCDYRPHTDFFAMRPSAMKPDSFFNMVGGRKRGPNHEQTAYEAFKHIVRSNRSRYLLDAAPSNGRCRVRGLNSSVYHMHNSCQTKAMKCNALDGWLIT